MVSNVNLHPYSTARRLFVGRGEEEACRDVDEMREAGDARAEADGDGCPRPRGRVVQADPSLNFEREKDDGAFNLNLTVLST